MWSPRENQNVAILDSEKKKIKDASDVENFLEALEDGGFSLPISKYQERSTFLVEV